MHTVKCILCRSMTSAHFQCSSAEQVLHTLNEQLKLLPTIEKDTIEGIDLSDEHESDDELNTHFDRLQVDIDSDDNDVE